MPANFGEKLGNSGASAARRAVVQRAEDYIRAHSDAPIRISGLCRAAGVSERGLRNAFYGVHGVGPKRWMVAQRLMRTQIALRASRDAATTVTEVATDFGFYQLGRFAAIYKKTFGETPSETLHAAGFIRGRSTHNTTKEQSDVIWI
jgi:AraC family ethanolamine operon transcriptional activator